jgi:glycosyltransferase involved in cell wall biosynthesis
MSGIVFSGRRRSAAPSSERGKVIRTFAVQEDSAESSAGSVSVVIPTRDRPDLLRRCIESVAAQDLRPREVIVMDDGTLDVSSLRAFCESCGLPLIHRAKGTPGTCASRNQGASAARGDYVLFLDDDVVLDPGYVRAVVRAFAEDRAGTLGGVGGSMEEPPAGSSRAARGLFRLLRLLFLLESRTPGRVLPSGFRTQARRTAVARDVEILSTSNSCYRRVVIDAVQFDERLDRLSGYAYGEDVDFSYRVSRRWRLRVIPEATGRHLCAPPHFVSRRRLERIYLIHHYLFLKRVLGRTPARVAAFAWALAGVVVCDLLAVLLRPGRLNLLLLDAHIAGIAVILTGRAERWSPSGDEAPERGRPGGRRP